MNLLLQCDGGSRGNPGPAAYGYVIYDTTSSAEIILEKCGNYLGITTNNQAEYQGLVAGIEWVVTNYPDAKLEIKMDSLLIVNQIKGLYKVKNKDLYPHHQKAQKLLAQLSSWSISHTYREGNSVADSMVNEALDAQTS